jgi:flavin-dependent dehydrogenase
MLFIDNISDKLYYKFNTETEEESMDFYDVAVCGAGPAGAAFAMTAPKNMKILLLDGSYAPKPCGGLLAPDAQKALASFELTLPKDILVDPQIFSVRTIDMRSGDVRRYQRMYINVDRDKFDNWMVSQAGENT